MNKNTTNPVTDNRAGASHHDGANTNTKEQSFSIWDDGTEVTFFNFILISIFVVILSLCIYGMSWDLMITIPSIIFGCAVSLLVSMLSSSKCIWSDKFYVFVMIIVYISYAIFIYMCSGNGSPSNWILESPINSKILLLSTLFGLSESLIVCFVFVPLLQKRQRAR